MHRKTNKNPVNKTSDLTKEKRVGNNNNGICKNYFIIHEADRLLELSSKNSNKNLQSYKGNKKSNITCQYLHGSGTNKSIPKNTSLKQSSLFPESKKPHYSSETKTPFNKAIINSNVNSKHNVKEGFLKGYERRMNIDSSNSSRSSNSNSNKVKENKHISTSDSKLLIDREKRDIDDKLKAEKAIKEMENRLKLGKENREKEERRNEETKPFKKNVQFNTKNQGIDTDNISINGEKTKNKSLEIDQIEKEKENSKEEEKKKNTKDEDTVDKEIDKSNQKELDSKQEPVNNKVSEMQSKEKLSISNYKTFTNRTNTTSSLISDTRIDEIINNRIGMSNLGNTCFMNTCLQLIIHSSPFISRLYQSKDYIYSSSPRSKPLTKSFYSLCEEVRLSQSSISPTSFKSSFSQSHHEYLGYSQHDTQEFCRLFLEDLSKELNLVIKTPQYRELDSEKKSKAILNKDYDLFFKERENSIVIDTFYGQTINIFRCTCSFESYSFEKFLDLPILLGNSETEIETPTLNDLLKKHFAKESFEWGEKCEKCLMKTMHDKDIRLSHLPEILFISFQRFNPRTKRKNSTKIQFSEELNLVDYVDKECLGDQSTKYKLIGISHHSGSIDFGHYYAYVKLKSGWFEFNDSHVSKIGSISCNTVYILEYQREDINYNNYN